MAEKCVICLKTLEVEDPSSNDKNNINKGLETLLILIDSDKNKEKNEMPNLGTKLTCRICSDVLLGLITLYELLQRTKSTINDKLKWVKEQVLSSQSPIQEQNDNKDQGSTSSTHEAEVRQRLLRFTTGIEILPNNNSDTSRTFLGESIHPSEQCGITIEDEDADIKFEPQDMDFSHNNYEFDDFVPHNLMQEQIPEPALSSSLRRRRSLRKRLTIRHQCAALGVEVKSGDFEEGDASQWQEIIIKNEVQTGQLSTSPLHFPKPKRSRIEKIQLRKFGLDKVPEPIVMLDNFVNVIPTTSKDFLYTEEEVKPMMPHEQSSNSKTIRHAYRTRPKSKVKDLKSFQDPMFQDSQTAKDKLGDDDDDDFVLGLDHMKDDNDPDKSDSDDSYVAPILKRSRRSLKTSRRKFACLDATGNIFEEAIKQVGKKSKSEKRRKTARTRGSRECACDMCPSLPEMTPSKFRKHMRQAHPGIKDPTIKYVECTCGKPFQSNSRFLERHRWSHCNEEEIAQKLAAGQIDPRPIAAKYTPRYPNVAKFKCTECGKLFKIKKSLSEHMNIHKDESEQTKWICEYCARVFVLPSTLRMHLKLVHNPDTVNWKVCSICDEKFALLAKLKIHMIHHHGKPREFQCDQCGMEFVQHRDLKRHLIIHLGPDYRPLKCEFCPETYRHERNLKRHLKNVHKDKVPPPVKNPPNNLTRPIYHTCKQMYPCLVEDCPKLFELPSRRKKHLFAAHGLDANGETLNVIDSGPKKKSVKSTRTPKKKEYTNSDHVIESEDIIEEFQGALESSSSDNDTSSDTRTNMQLPYVPNGEVTQPNNFYPYFNCQ